jgi:tetratricopeptide (TPR) repeat protein
MRVTLPVILAALLGFARLAAADELAVCMNDNSAPRAAVEACSRSIASAYTNDENLAKLYEWRAHAREKLGEFDGAVADYNEAIRIVPNDINAYGNRAWIFLARGEYQKVIANWTEVIRIDPKNTAAHVNLGAARYMNGDVEGAIAEFDKALTFGPDQATLENLLNNRGAALRDKGEFDRAFADLDQAIRLNPNNQRAWYNRALVWQRKGDSGREIEDETRAIAIDPTLASALTARGLAHERQGRLAQAKADFNAALAAPQRYYDTRAAQQKARERLTQLSSPAGPPTAIAQSGTAAPASEKASKSIALIIDASGSMNAKLPEGRTRIDAAKAAVGEIVGKMPPDVRISLRAYGHQSPTSKHDCKDTAVLVGFGGLANNRDAIVASTRSIKAQGYTPITYVLKLAAEDVGKEATKPRIVILVSDGKETCEGDPCATAKALAAADASLIIHTIGFAADSAAKYQLQCIARVARGKYWDADSTGRLAAALGEAAEPPPPVQKTAVVVVEKPKPGRLLVRNAGMGGHKVINAETNAVVANLNSSGPSAELPPGIYNVVFGKAVWKGVEVRAGETTTLEPAVIEVRHASLTGHKVLDNETGEQVGSIVSSNPRLTVLPSTFAVTFGKAVWKDIEVKGGEHKVLNPGVIEIIGADISGHNVRDGDGKVVESIMSSSPRAALPPGKYTVEIGAQKVPVDLVEGQTVQIRVK